MKSFIETKEEKCLVCGDPVSVATDLPDDEPVLCMIHFFTYDASEEWEAGDGTVGEE